MDSVNLIKRIAVGGALAGGLCYATLTGAATQGSLATGQSVGTTDLTLTIPEQVLINNLDDIPLTYTAGTAPTAQEDFCVYSGTGNFDITISSLNGSGAFDAVNGGDANALVYTVRFDDDLAFATPTAVTENVQVAGGPWADDGVTNLCGVDNSAIDVTFTEGGLAGDVDGGTVVVGDYTDTMTLTVIPN